MAVSDGMVMLLLICALNFFILWRKGGLRRLVGDLFFIFIGIASNYVLSITDYPWMFIISIIAMIDFVYGALNPESI